VRRQPRAGARARQRVVRAMGGEDGIRTTTEGDAPALAELYRAAFPAEDLLPLVRRLMTEVPGLLSLAAVEDGEFAGHVLFTPCDVDDAGARVALLGPLAVLPTRQGRGIGTALVRDGFRRLGEVGVARVLVLGDPDYYARFGFAPERLVLPPYALPEAWVDAWQSRDLANGAARIAGRLLPPPAWLTPGLWQP
jgi:putative acetyltransferase